MPTLRPALACIFSGLLLLTACSTADEPATSADSTPEPAESTSTEASTATELVAWDDVILTHFDACYATGTLQLGFDQGPGKAQVPAPEPIVHSITAEYDFELSLGYSFAHWQLAADSGKQVSDVPFSCLTNDPAFSADGSYVEFDAGTFELEIVEYGKLRVLNTVRETEPLQPAESAGSQASSDGANSTGPTTSAAPTTEPESSAPGAVDPAQYRTTDVNGLGHELYAFSTPSGLHSCMIAPYGEGEAAASATCLMTFRDGADVEHSDFGLSAPYVDADGAYTLTISDTYYMAMDSERVLEYGSSLSAYGITCSTSPDGITCRAGAHSFEASSGRLHYPDPSKS